MQPGSPAEGQLQPGDILVRVNGKLVATFDPLAEVLDSSVGQGIDVEVERGGEVVPMRLVVQDLTAITPARYLEFGDTVVHDLSYQMARHLNVPVRGVFVANPGYTMGSAGVPRGAVISSVAGKPVATLADFQQAVAGLADGARVTVRYTTLENPTGSETRVMRMDRRWYAGTRMPARRPDGPVAVPRPAAGAAGRGDGTGSNVVRDHRRCAGRPPCPVAGAGELLACRSRWPASPSGTTTGPASWWTPLVDSWPWIATPCRSRWATCA